MGRAISFIIALFLVWPLAVNADDPLITSTSGIFLDGATVTLSGSNFGSHSLDIEWLGGSSGPIESGTTGNSFSRTNWSHEPGGSFVDFKYATDQAHSGSKSLKGDLSGSEYSAALYYDYGSTIGVNVPLFVSWWVMKDDADNTGQWKMFRLRWDKQVTDTAPEIALFNWNPGGDGMKQFIERPGGGEIWNENNHVFWIEDPSPRSQCYPGGDYTWYRMDLYLFTSSLGTRDGYGKIYLFHPSGGNVVLNPYDAGSEWPNLLTYSSDETDRWRYFLWQNYRGNGLESMIVWLDDVYIQVGTRARVEIGDNSTWANCTHREIQLPTAWADGEITITVNQGSFAPCERAYLYVVDAKGQVSNPKEITIAPGEGGAPCPPPDLVRVK